MRKSETDSAIRTDAPDRSGVNILQFRTANESIAVARNLPGRKMRRIDARF